MSPQIVYMAPLCRHTHCNEEWLPCSEVACMLLNLGRRGATSQAGGFSMQTNITEENLGSCKCLRALPILIYDYVWRSRPRRTKQNFTNLKNIWDYVRVNRTHSQLFCWCFHAGIRLFLGTLPLPIWSCCEKLTCLCCQSCLCHNQVAANEHKMYARLIRSTSFCVCPSVITTLWRCSINEAMLPVQVSRTLALPSALKRTHLYEYINLTLT